MAYLNEQSFLSFQAAENLTAFKYRAVRLSSEGFVNVASNAGANTCIGILDNDPASGTMARVAVSGTSKIYAGGAITAGVLVTHTASGYATAATSGQLVIGRAITTAGAAGDIITIQQADPAFFAAIAV